MTTRTKVIIITSVLVLAGGLAIAGMTRADSRGWGGHHGGYYGGPSHGGWHEGRHGGHHKGRRFHRMFESYDTNGDGKLTQAEIDAARADRLARFDADGDQSLTLEEYEALWVDAMRDRMVDRFQHLDENGDAIVTAEEFSRPFARIVQFMDRNDDGEISRDDMRRKGYGPRGDSDKDND